MRILYLKNALEQHEPLLEAWQRRDVSLTVISIPNENEILLQELANGEHMDLLQALNDRGFDFVFSLDFYPCIAEICFKLGQLYQSWILEPPYSAVYSNAALYETNRIFLTDKFLAEKLESQGVSTVFYLPEGAFDTSTSGESLHLAEMRCSFVGDIRRKTWNDVFQTSHLKDATLGYLEGLITCQHLVYGYDFFENPVPGYVLEDLKANSSLHVSYGSVEGISEYYAEQAYYPMTSDLDRKVLAQVAGMVNFLDVFGNGESDQSNVTCHPAISFSQRAEVYRRSQINLCATPRGMRDGVSGDLIQMLAAGAFVLTDYRSALFEEFVPGEDFVIYEDMDHLKELLKYYFAHEDERKRIAESGKRKALERHGIEKRLEIFEGLIDENQ